MLYTFENNKLVKNELETDLRKSNILYEQFGKEKIISEIINKDEIVPTLFEKYDEWFNIDDYYIFVNYIYKNSFEILKDIIENPNKNIELLKLLKNDFSKLIEIRKILSNNKDLNFIKVMYEDFYLFSTKVLNIINIKPLETEVNDNKDILLQAYNNSTVLNFSRKINRLNKR